MMRDKGGGGGTTLKHDEGQGGEGVQLSDMMRDTGGGGGEEGVQLSDMMRNTGGGGGRGGGGTTLRHDEGQGGGEGRRGYNSQT